MIQANELPRGNMVNYQGVKLIVNSVSATNVGLCYPANFGEFQYSNTPIKDIKPIPLTEELLLKCGFIKYDYKYRVDYYIGLFKIWYSKIYNQYFYKVRNTKNIELKSLYKLQNIYFDLEEKELEINL